MLQTTQRQPGFEAGLRRVFESGQGAMTLTLVTSTSAAALVAAVMKVIPRPRQSFRGPTDCSGRSIGAREPARCRVGSATAARCGVVNRRRLSAC